MLNKTISVWLVLKDGNNKGRAALQKRSEKEVHFAFVCQATWAGKVEENESVEDAIVRERKEELGEDFNFNNLKFFSENKFEFNEKEWTCYNYVGEITEKDLFLAKIHDNAVPEFIFAGEKNINELVLFEDQCKVLKDIYDAKGNRQ